MLVERATSIIYAVIKLPHRRPMGGIRVLYKSNSRPAILWQLDEVYRAASACRNYAQMQARATILEHDIQELVHKYKLLNEHYITKPVRAWLLCIPPTFQHWHGCATSIMVKDVELTIQKVDKEIAALKRRAKREADKIVKNHPHHKGGITMPVRPYAHSTSNNDSHKAAFYARKPIGINKQAPTPGSNTQKRKANRLSGKHQPHRK